MPLSALSFVFLFGCPPIPTDEPPAEGDTAPADPDADADGSLESVDCDDADAAVHPGADERCNEVDDDCDGDVDEDPVDARSFWPDADGDGFGDAGAVRLACTQPTGFADDDTDCDDGDATIHPGATEVCDDADVDEDCDGLADDADGSVDASGGIVGYEDGDGDGIGGADSRRFCTLPAGYALVGGDCDDRDAEHTQYCYTSGYGELEVATECAYRLDFWEGGEAVCPACDFAFAADATLTAGDCIESFTANLGFEDATYLLDFRVYTDDGSFDLGPFDSALSSQIGFVILNFSGPRTDGHGEYSGYLAMYPG